MEEMDRNSGSLLKEFEELREKYTQLKQNYEKDQKEREQTEEALRESGELYRAILSASPDDITITDLEGKVLVASAKAATMFGYTDVNEILGRPIIDFLAPEEREKAGYNISLMFKGVLTGPGEYLGLRKDGSQVDIEANGEFIRDCNGEPVKIVFIVRDISQRKFIERTLRESEERFRKLLQNLPAVAVQGYRKDGITNYWNLASEKLYGFTAIEAIGRNLTDLIIPPEMREEVKRAINYMLDTGRPVPASELTLIRKDGSPVNVFSSHAVVKVPGLEPELFCIDIDLSELKRSEKALKESESNFLSFFATIDDMIVVALTDGKIIFANNSFRQKLGYSDDEIERMNIFELHPPDKREEAKQIFGEMLAGRRKFCPLPIETKKEELLLVETKVWLGFWNGVECLFGIIKDLSAAEEANQRFERLFRNNPAPMALTELPSRRFYEVNYKFLKTFGYSAEDIIGKTASEINLFPDKELMLSAVEKLLNEGILADTELIIKAKDGSLHNGLFSGEMISSQGKQFALTVMVDISERKKMEAELLNKTAELDNYFKNSLDLLCIATTSGKFLRLNPEWEKVLGYKIDELEGGQFMDYIHQDDLSATKEALSLLFDQKEVLSFENRYRCKDGSYRWIEWRSKSVGEIIYAVARDVTYRKQADEKIKSLLREKELLLHEVHHRIKNNMNTVYSLLMLQADSHEDPSVKKVLLDAAGRVHCMEILYAKLYRSEFTGKVELKEYLPVLAAEIVNQFARKDIIKVNSQIDDIALDVRVLSPLGIIISELITNSMKYAFQKCNEGTINITALNLENKIRIIIEDDGKNIPESFSLENSSGFGLQLVKILVEQISGSIELNCENFMRYTIDIENT